MEALRGGLAEWRVSSSYATELYMYCTLAHITHLHTVLRDVLCIIWGAIIVNVFHLHLILKFLYSNMFDFNNVG